MKRLKLATVWLAGCELIAGSITVRVTGALVTMLPLGALLVTTTK